MSTQSLDLKYRPRHFKGILGNAGVVKLLTTRSQSGTLSGRSMMFSGPKGCGKTSLARVVGKAIACPDIKDGEPCCICSTCKSIEEGTSDSFDEFDAATQGTVDRIRSIVQDLDFGTMDNRPRVIVLDEAHRLSKQSQDALLRPMEDRRVVVILCTTEPHLIRGAIRDRVEEYSVSPPSSNTLVDHLYGICKNENIKYDVEGLELLVQINRQNPRTSITSLETVSGMGKVTEALVREIYRFNSMDDICKVLSLLDADPASAFGVLDRLFANESPSWVRDSIVAAISSAIRCSVGAKPTYPVPTNFFPIRGRSWANLASALSRVDRPDEAAVEAILLEFPNGHVVSEILQMPAPVPSASPIAVPTPTPALTKEEPRKAVEEPKKVSVKPKPESKPKDIEHDGVRFTSNETLTSIDQKIRNSASSSVGSDKPKAELGVPYDQRLAPVPPKEFSRAFHDRFKATKE
jgi:DNA polymerase III subunit gamma/tau